MTNCVQNTDPFDLGGLRLSQDYAHAAGVKKKLLTVPARKPNKTEFVRVHPDAGYRLDTLVLGKRPVNGRG